MTADDPFAALGLPARPDLTDEQVRAAWRAIAAGTHPDKHGGENTETYTRASAAYAQLRTPWGRSEAYADLAEARGQHGATAPIPLPDPDPGGIAEPPWAPAMRAARAALQVPARIRRGRPLRLAIRGLAAAILALAVLHLIPGQPAAPAVITGIITWFLLTARSDLAPPPRR
jgi:hypothetical protein